MTTAAYSCININKVYKEAGLTRTRLSCYNIHLHYYIFVPPLRFGYRVTQRTNTFQRLHLPPGKTNQSSKIGLHVP